MKIKERIKRFIREPFKHFSRKNSYSNFKNAIIVGGLGRCGTTLMCYSLKNSGFPGDLIFFDRFDQQNELINGCYYKTHDYPPNYLPANVKLIYMFGNPMNIVISTHKKINEWGYLHHYHLDSDLYTFNDEIFYKDTLLLHKHFDAWYKNQNFEFISIKYESLYDTETLNVLKGFIGLELNLLPFVNRETSYKTHPHKKNIIRTYSELNEKIKNADNAKVWKPIINGNEPMSNMVKMP